MSKWHRSAERREAVRLASSVEVRVSWSGGQFTGLTANLSRHGLFVETDQRLRVRTAVRVRFDLPQPGRPVPIAARGFVVRTQKVRTGRGHVRGLGVRLEDFIEGRAALREYVEHRLERTDTVVAKFRERRAARRIDVGLPVRWGTGPEPDRDGLLSSLSVSGSFFIAGDHAVPTGTRVYLRFDLLDDGETRNVRAVGHVTRVVEGRHGQKGLAVQFDAASMDIDTIAGFVSERTGGEDAAAKRR